MCQRSFDKMIDEREKEIVQALQLDLSKPELEAFVSEVFFICQNSLIYSFFALSSLISMYMHIFLLWFLH